MRVKRCSPVSRIPWRMHSPGRTRRTGRSVPSYRHPAAAGASHAAQQARLTLSKWAQCSSSWDSQPPPSGLAQLPALLLPLWATRLPHERQLMRHQQRPPTGAQGRGVPGAPAEDRAVVVDERFGQLARRQEGVQGLPGLTAHGSTRDSGKARTRGTRGTRDAEEGGCSAAGALHVCCSR